jgi:hypothetical protein
MNKRVKAKWVKALRSGKYKKGVGQLAELITVPVEDGWEADDKVVGEKFCCLGVLCDLYDKEKKNKERSWNEEQGELPEEVMEWAGLDMADPVVKFNADKFNEHHDVKIYGKHWLEPGRVTLSSLNDHVCVLRKKGFAMIADVIEKQL